MLKFNLDFSLFNNSYYFYERLLVIAFSLVPTLILVFFVLYSDKKSKEPLKNVLICLLSGILTIALSNYFEGLAQNYFNNNIFLIYLFALIEELSKISIFMLFIFDNKFYDDIYDGIIYMMLIALSFAGLENIMYAFSESTINDSINLALLRDLTTIPLHVICGIVIGYFISLSNFSKYRFKKYINFIKAIIYSSLIHAVFNTMMEVLDKLNIDNNNYLQLVIFQTLPILIIMIILFYIAIKVSKKNIYLNEIFVSNSNYDDKYSYLMKKDEYEQSYNKLKRHDMYFKTKLMKQNNKDMINYD